MTSPTQSPGMSELRGLLEKANSSDAVVADVFRLGDAASTALPTLLDDLAAAQGDIERLREALQMMVDEEVDYMTRNNLGDPEKQHTIRVARSALTLKSEEKQGLSSSRDLKPTPVASEPKNSDVQQVK